MVFVAEAITLYGGGSTFDAICISASKVNILLPSIGFIVVSDFKISGSLVVFLGQLGRHE